MTSLKVLGKKSREAYMQSQFFIVFFAGFLTFFGCPSLSFSESHDEMLLGKPIQVQAENKPLSQGVRGSTRVVLDGVDTAILDYVLKPGELDLYIKGKKIWDGKLSKQGNDYIYDANIPYTQLAFPVVTYPLGPVMLKVDVGADYEMDLQARYFGDDQKFNFEMTGSSHAFVEGYGSLSLFRGGVGAQLLLLEARLQAGLTLQDLSQSYFNSRYEFLSGMAYGFVDSRWLSQRWRRWFRIPILTWQGKCLGTGGFACGS